MNNGMGLFLVFIIFVSCWGICIFLEKINETLKKIKDKL